VTHLVRIVEVSPRDGLQSEPAQVATSSKIELIQHLVAAGLKEIEITAFVRPERVPQLADAEALCRQLERPAGVRFSALVPNLQGLQRAHGVGINAVAFFGAATETFCQKNIGCTIAESLQRCKALLGAFRKQGGGWFRAYISCAFGCPYEGKVDFATVSHLAGKLADLGCDEIVLADTIGVATPKITRQLMLVVSQQVLMRNLTLHLHDTRGQALANVYACLELEIGAIDASVAGLGGCPYAPGATGNLATEDLVYMLEGCGVDTGIDLDQLIKAGRFISAELGRANQSRVSIAGGRFDEL